MVSFLLFTQAGHIVCLGSNDLQDLPLHLLELMTMLRMNQQYYLVVAEIDVVRFTKHSSNFRMTVIRSLSVKTAVDRCSRRSNDDKVEQLYQCQHAAQIVQVLIH